MENQTNTNGETRPDEAAASRIDQLGEKLKERFAGVKAQIDASQAKAREKLGHSKLATVQERIRGAVQHAMGRVKTGLDLPSRSEVSALAQRIEDLDKKLADYESREVSRKSKKKGDEATA
jgi:polyhydroxyalkanoate synthesis regulator phasin